MRGTRHRRVGRDLQMRDCAEVDWAKFRRDKGRPGESKVDLASTALRVTQCGWIAGGESVTRNGHGHRVSPPRLVGRDSTQVRRGLRHFAADPPSIVPAL